MAGAISKLFSYPSRCFRVRGRTVRKNSGYHRIQTSRTRKGFVAAFILVLMFTLSAVLIVTPSSAAAAITLTPKSGAALTVVTVTGSGFTPSTTGSTITITIKYGGMSVTPGPSNTYGSAQTDFSGSFAGVTFTVPSPALGVGPHTVTVTDSNGVFATATFWLTSLKLEYSNGTVATKGPVGTLITASGSGFVPSPSSYPTYNQIIVTLWGTWGSFTTTSNTVYTDQLGNFSDLNFTIPLSPAGGWTVQASDYFGNVAVTPFTVGPSITLSPTTGPPGTAVTVSGAGFVPNNPLTIKFNGAAVASGGYINGSGGFLGVRFSVPSAAYGTYTVLASDTSVSAQANFTVAPTTTIVLTVSYSVIGGGSGYSPPIFYFNGTQGYASQQYTLTTTPTTLRVASDASWSVRPNPLTGSTSSERWYSNQQLSGTPTNNSFVFKFYNQYLESFNIPSQTTTTVGSPSFNLTGQINTQTGTPTVTLSSFPVNPGNPTSYPLLGKWVDFRLSSAGGVNWVVVRVYFTQADLTSSGLSESNLALYYLYGSLWQQCIGSQVDNTTNSVWMQVTASTTPNLSQLTGTVFSVGPAQNQPTTTTTSTTTPSTSPTPVYPLPTSTPPFNPSPTTSPGTFQCIIATAAYGSAMAPEVVYMRHVRDNMIGSSQTGRTLVNGWNTFYYSWSPPLAQLIASNDALQSTFRVLLLPLVGIIHLTASIYTLTATVNTSFAAVIAFLSAAITSTAIYVVTPLFIILQIRKRFRTHFNNQ